MNKYSSSENDMGITLIPNVGTVPDQLRIKDRLMNMVVKWYDQNCTINESIGEHWNNYVFKIDLERLEKECGIKFIRWAHPGFTRASQVAKFEAVDEKLYAWFLLKYA